MVVQQSLLRSLSHLPSSFQRWSFYPIVLRCLTGGSKHKRYQYVSAPLSGFIAIYDNGVCNHRHMNNTSRT